MYVGVDVSQHQLPWEELLRRVRFAEDAGFASVWVFDHFTPLYGDPEGPCLEAWTLLAALAASTARVRLGVLVTGVTYRHPSLLAAEAVTVDHVSGGRLDLGIGAAWFEAEHRRLGFDFPPTGERIDRLEEHLQIVTALLAGADRPFTGRTYRLEQTRYRPLPVQRPHPPIWIGASGERRMLPLVARHADVWHSFGSPDDLARKSALLDGMAREAGRDPAAIARSTSLSLSEPWDELRATVDRLRGVGVSSLIASWPAEGWPRIEELADKVLPDLAAA